MLRKNKYALFFIIMWSVVIAGTFIGYLVSGDFYHWYIMGQTAVGSLIANLLMTRLIVSEKKQVQKNMKDSFEDVVEVDMNAKWFNTALSITWTSFFSRSAILMSSDQKGDHLILKLMMMGLLIHVFSYLMEVITLLLILVGTNRRYVIGTEEILECKFGGKVIKHQISGIAATRAEIRGRKMRCSLYWEKGGSVDFTILYRKKKQRDAWNRLVRTIYRLPENQPYRELGGIYAEPEKLNWKEATKEMTTIWNRNGRRIMGIGFIISGFVAIPGAMAIIGDDGSLREMLYFLLGIVIFNIICNIYSILFIMTGAKYLPATVMNVVTVDGQDPKYGKYLLEVKTEDGVYVKNIVCNADIYPRLVAGTTKVRMVKVFGKKIYVDAILE